jgi:hypothetical protein
MSRITVTVEHDGRVGARRREDDAHSPTGQVGYDGLNADLVGLFERWLTLRDRSWREDEIRVFGTLLHTCLFPEPVWGWVQRAIDNPEDGPVRLALTFPASPPFSRLAAVPWEYLHTPDRAGRRGTFLAYDPAVVLSRYIPLESGIGSLSTETQVRVLVVVSQPDDPRLAEVVADPVLEAIGHAAKALKFKVQVVRDPTAEDLSHAIITQEPHLVHFMGHGEFDPDRGQGSLALASPSGGADWVDDRRLADLLRRASAVPRVVLLHSCEGGRTDYAASFAGLAPQLIRSGVQCVVAMQYAVTNETAIEFSTSFYEQLAKGRALDETVQECRWRISGLIRRDARLLGIPVVYLHSRDALLAPRRPAPPEIRQGGAS